MNYKNFGRLWALLCCMLIGSLPSAKAQMVSKKINMLYYKVQDVWVDYDGISKYYLGNQPTGIIKIPQITTTVATQPNTPFPLANDYNIVDKTNGSGPYVLYPTPNPAYAFSGDEAVALYWSTYKAFEYFETKFKYVGVSNNPAKETNALRIAANGTFSDGVAAYVNDDKSKYNVEFLIDQQAKPYTLDVMGHEIAHGIMDYHNISNTNQTVCANGYISEGIADVFGILAKNYTLQKILQQQNPNAVYNYDWTLKVENNLPIYDASSAISMQIAKYPVSYFGKNYDNSCIDPHLNRTLIPYWFYLLSMGGSANIDLDPAKPEFIVSGISINQAEKILWRTMTEFLPAYDANMTWANFRQAAEQAATAEYGATSPQLYSVQDAFFAIGLGSSSAQLLVSTPKNQAVGINPWPVNHQNGETNLEKVIQYPTYEKEWEVDICTDKDFKSGTPVYTSNSLTKATNTKLVNGILYLVLPPINLQANTTYYWRVRTTGFDPFIGPSPNGSIFLHDQLALGLDVRSFTTDGREVTGQHIESYYPWGVPFTWTKLDDVPIIQNYIVHVYHKNDQEELFAKSFVATNASTQVAPTDKPNYVVLRAGDFYNSTVSAQGPNDVFGQKSFGLESKKLGFQTTVPTTNLVFPTNNMNLNPFDKSYPNLDLFSLNWGHTLNAEGYHFEVSQNKVSFTNPVLDNSSVGQYSTTTPFHPQPNAIGNNIYFWRVTPKAPTLTKSTNPNLSEGIQVPGKTTDPFTVLYNYGITKPTLTEFPTVDYSQSSVSFTFATKAGSNAGFYRLSVAKRGELGLKNIIQEDIVVENVNTSSVFTKTYQAASKGGGILQQYDQSENSSEYYDLSTNPNGYEWSVQSFNDEGTIAGEAAKSSYDVMPGASIILTPANDELVDLKAVQNKKVNYVFRCPFDPFGCDFKLGLGEEGREVIDLLSPNKAPYLLDPGNDPQGMYSFTDIFTALPFDTDIFAQIIAKGRPGSGLEGAGEIIKFRTPPGKTDAPAQSGPPVPMQISINNNMPATLSMKLVNLNDPLSEINAFNTVDQNHTLIESQAPGLIGPYNAPADGQGYGVLALGGTISPGSWQIVLEIIELDPNQANPNFNIFVHDDLQNQVLKDIHIDQFNYVKSQKFTIPFTVAP